MIGYIYQLINPYKSFEDEEYIDYSIDTILVAIVFADDENDILAWYENSEYNYEGLALTFDYHESMIYDELEKIDIMYHKSMIFSLKNLKYF